MTTTLLRSAAALAMLCGASAHAQQATSPTLMPTPVSTPTPSPNAMVNLVRALVAKGTLSPTEGQALLDQANAEASHAAAPPGTVRVPYVPESVRAQIRDELKEDVLQTAKAEGWATPGTGRVQPWVSNVRIFGDFRYRAQFNTFARGNATNILDFGAINAPANGTEFNSALPSGTGSTYTGLPRLNTSRDRNNLENLRLRVGLDARVNDWADITFRLASGDTNSPVSTSQALGGGFVKKGIYIDQAYAVIRPIDDVALTGGRMPNPFYSYDVLWDPDLNFDGITLGAGHNFGDLRVSGVAGAFPYEYGSDNFPTVSDSGKTRTTNKWLYAAQIVGNWQARHDIGVKVGGAYYHFTNVQGQPSDPCDISQPGAQCSTDSLRPAFQQKGNTVFFLRNIVPPANFPTDFPNRQFVGLNFDYHILDITGDVTVKLDDAKSVTVGGDYIKNLAFDRNAICRSFPSIAAGTTGAVVGPINNRTGTGCAAAGNDTTFSGGDTAWMARVSVGYPSPKHWGEWNVFGAYKYIQTDAVLDGLVDNEFHLGGTNAQGYVIAGRAGLYDNVAARVKYQSANQISGPPLGIDVLQLDLLVAF